MSDRITVFGSFLVDLMCRAEHLPAPGQTVKGSLFRQGAGGKGSNQAIAAHLAGGKVAAVFKLGKDTMAQVALQTMQDINLSCEQLLFSENEPTGVALIMVDEQSSQNEIVIVPGACAQVTPQDVQQRAACIKDSAYLLLQLEMNAEANELAARLAKQNGVRVVVNTAPYQPMSEEFYRGVYLVTPNEVEAQELTGVAVTDLASAGRAAQVLFDLGVENVIITLGARGVYLNDRKRAGILPAFTVQAVDTTGAGDAFNGGLLTALAEGKELWQAARFANALAALSVQKIGAAPSMPKRAEIEAFLRTQPDG